MKKVANNKDDYLIALNELAEKGMDTQTVVEVLEAALAAAYKKNFVTEKKDSDVQIKARVTDGGIKVYAYKTVVEFADDDESQSEISLADAREISGRYNIGDVIEVEVTPNNFKRIAATTAKQVVIQRLREAEREKLYSKVSEKKRNNENVVCTVERIENDNLYVMIDGDEVEAELPRKEQVRTEEYYVGQKLYACISDINTELKNARVILSRTHPDFVKNLFRKEVAEIAQGIVEIKSVSRDAGSRTKIAVWSNDPDVDPQGACIGKGGERVKNIGKELGNEKIDIIKWSENPSEFIAASLSPAQVISVEIIEDGEDTRTEEPVKRTRERKGKAKVKVPEYQLSLAIGKSGQNVSLAAKLTGWKIDISTDEEE